MTQVRFEAVSYCYPSGAEALNEINLQLDGSGGILLIAGRNGSGKTTLLKHVNGLLRPTSGRVVVGGADTRTKDSAELAHVVAMSFQRPDDQIFCATALEEVCFGPRNLGKPDYLLLGQRALERCHLSQRGGDNPFELHPSERRWLAIASVLAMDTPCVAMDEPTAGMGAGEKVLLEETIRQMRAEDKLILVSSHDLEFFLPLCERIVLLDAGAMIFDGAAADLFGRTDVRRLARRAGIRIPVIPRLARSLHLTPAIYRAVDLVDSLFSQYKEGTGAQ